MNEVILDLKEFLERVQDDKELLLELFDIFTEDFQLKRTSLTESIAKKEYEQIRSIAHSLKGASGNISAKRLRTTCLKLEEMGRANNLEGIDQILLDLDKNFKDLLDAIVETKKTLK